MRATVIVYHAVGPCPRTRDRHNLFISSDVFAQQMAYLARRRRVVPLEDVIAGKLEAGPPAVAITFDDGYRSVVAHALPFLRRYGFAATVFVPSAFIGDRNRWVDAYDCDLSIMTADDLRTAGEAGLVVESHGHRHIDMSAVRQAEIESDMKESLRTLKAMTGRFPRFIAYPFGRSSAAAQNSASAAGFQAGFTIDMPHEGRFAYARVAITPLDGPRLFALKTSSRYLELRHSWLLDRGYRLVRPLVRRMIDR